LAGVSDYQRSAVYSAEDQWAASIDRGGAMDFHGSHVVMPEQRRFTDLDDVKTYVVEICGRHGMHPPSVRHRKGGGRAHYEHAGVIAIPSDQGWAMRESVVLHELAHHQAAGMDHGPQFTAAMLRLVEAELGPEAALVLRAAYASNLVDVHVID
jgi:putative metallohydrolase (TIGR04338 family)